MVPSSPTTENVWMQARLKYKRMRIAQVREQEEEQACTRGEKEYGAATQTITDKKIEKLLKKPKDALRY